MPFIKNVLGIRISSHPLIKFIINNVDFPVTATSANIAGQPAVYSAEEVLKQFRNRDVRPDLIIDGGELKRGMISTVVDLTRGEIKCLREGVIKLHDLR